NSQLKQRYASALLNTGVRADMTKARDVLKELVTSSPNDTRSLYLLSQAQRRLGDLNAAEATARQVITKNPKSPWGYYALAETLEERHQYKAVIDTLTPALSELRGGGGAGSAGGSGGPDRFALTMLLPHVGFAYQELREFDKALATFQEAHRLSPDDPSVTGYLIQAYISAKKYPAAIQLADEARVSRPNDLRLARLGPQALKKRGRVERAGALQQTAVKANDNDPSAYVALAQLYSEVDRGDEAVKVLNDAQVKFPSDGTIQFELGAVFDKQKRFPE